MAVASYRVRPERIAFGIWYGLILHQWLQAEAAVCAPGTIGATSASMGTLQASRSFASPRGLTVSSDNLFAYVVERDQNRVAKVDLQSGTVTTLTGGNGQGAFDGASNVARFNSPSEIVISPDNLELYLGGGAGHRVRKVDVLTGDTWTLSGTGNLGYQDGDSTNAQFRYPHGMALSPDGQVLFTTCQTGRIRTVQVSNGTAGTLSGIGKGFADGDATVARFQQPDSLALSPDGANIYVSDYANWKIRQVRVADGYTTTLSGSGDYGSADGYGTEATWKYVYKVVASLDGQFVFAAESDSHKIRQIRLADQAVTTILGSSSGYADGVGTNALMSTPRIVQVAPSSSELYVTTEAGRIRTVTLNLTCESCENSSYSIPHQAFYTQACNWDCQIGYYSFNSTECRRWINPVDSLMLNSGVLAVKAGTVILAELHSVLTPAVAEKLDEFLVTGGSVSPYHSDGVRCFNSSHLFGEDLCYKISDTLGSCNIVET